MLTGGISAASRAAEYGVKTAVIESGRWGGTCVNVGCVPKKLMYNAAHLAESRALLAGYGFDDGGRPPAFDWTKLKLKRDAYVAALNGGYLDDLRETGIAHFGAHAKFVGERRVELSTGEVIEAEHVLVATGSQPALPSVPGIEHAISSDGFFDLPALPRSVLLVGAHDTGGAMSGTFCACGA